jgi:hypothetical protein
LIPSRIHKVLSTMAKHQVRALLMGGQACVFYGAAEFSRDTDLAVLAEPENWQRLNHALAELQAESIAVPPSDIKYLLQGYALHFRCHHPEAEGMRVDIMSRMRGVDDFPKIWERRTTLTSEDGSNYEVLSLPDLVQAKKTQRDKDWPMIRRLIEADYGQNEHNPDPAHLRFWLRELRTPELLIKVATVHSGLAGELVSERPLIALAVSEAVNELAAALENEEKRERETDGTYWLPLKKELEKMRHSNRP